MWTWRGQQVDNVHWLVESWFQLGGTRGCFLPVVYMPSKQVIRIQPLDSHTSFGKNQSSFSLLSSLFSKSDFCSKIKWSKFDSWALHFNISPSRQCLLRGNARGFPDSSVGKESACNAGDPGLGRPAGEVISYPFQHSWASLVTQLVKTLPAMWETWVWSLGWEDPLEKGKATGSSIPT